MLDSLTKLLKSEENFIYLLMNKDSILAEFVVEKYMSLSDITKIEELQKIPQWLKPLDGFIRGRRAPKGREHIEELLERSGCDDLLGYLDITHALSLIDTYWVKSKDSKLTWRDVSLYTNPFNEVIAKTAFEGGLHGDQLSTTSPEYGTDGTFAKCWIREDGQIKLLKRGTRGFANAGKEPYSEHYATQIANKLGIDCVEYNLRMRSGTICSVCDIFTSEKEGYLPYSAVSSRYSTPLSVLKDYAKYGCEEFEKNMFVFDAVILNIDRHKGNFGFIVNNNTQEIIRSAPLFDHNLSLLCYAMEEDFNNKYMSQLGPKIGNKFNEDARALLTPKMRKNLINLKGFKFERHPKYNLSEERLNEIERIVNRQITEILK